uniref:DUF456 domain-containing protein n=1 Tax=candidate division WOR-3 bacterium TaxID=2052148 RepID=A0A7C4Y4W2_UNCW3
MIYFTIFLFLAGIAGSFFHYLPSTTLVFIGIYFYALKDGFNVITKDFILLLAIITAFSVIFDNFFLFFKNLKKARIFLKIFFSIILIVSFFIKIL